ncbi:MAG: NAD(P)H:quinone oxidoreductase [Candidatus Azambacteria bacterium]|nr:NAD(P)H:quinone oxidoreductase [Candidatus Azambacteria bacterium]
MEAKKIKILVLFYTTGGCTADFAREIGRGAASVAGAEVTLRRIPEILPREALGSSPERVARMEALEKEFPEATIEDLIEADGVAFGTPVHFGSFASQVKHFLDQLTLAWHQQKLVNKPAAVFCVGHGMHSGEEAALLSLIIPLLNLGMIPVGIPYPIQSAAHDFDAGSPYGAIFISAGGKRQMTDMDKKVAQILGRRLASMATLLSCGCESCGACHELTKSLPHP